MKACTKCKIEKPFSEFYPRKDRAGGYLSSCKTCNLQANKKYLQRKANERKEYKARYREENNDRISKYNKEYYSENAIKLRAASRRWTKSNPDAVHIRNKQQTEKLTDSYVSSQIGFGVAEAPRALIELKRQQLEIYRIARNLKSKLKGDAK